MSTPQEIAQALKSLNRPRSKYGAVPVVVNGLRFASKKEAARYRQLCVLAQAGEIEQLVVQPRFTLTVRGVILGEYVADFSYQDRELLIVEDVKSPATRTAIYRWKVKHLKAEYGIAIREV